MGRKPEGKAEKLFKDLGKKVDELLADLKVAKDKAEVEYADQIDELKRNGETIKDEIKGFHEKHKDRFDEAEDSLKKAGEKIEDAFKRVFSRD